MTDMQNNRSEVGTGSPTYNPSSPTYAYTSSPMDDTPYPDDNPSSPHPPSSPKDDNPVPSRRVDREYVSQRRNFSNDRANIRKGDSYRRSGGSRRTREIVDTLEKERGSVSEGRLSRWFPNTNIAQALIKCKNVRFSRDKSGGRRWAYETDREVQKDVFTAVSDGCSSLDSIQRRVSRRFVVVRRALSALERCNRLVSTSAASGEQSWYPPTE